MGMGIVLVPMGLRDPNKSKWKEGIGISCFCAAGASPFFYLLSWISRCSASLPIYNEAYMSI